MSGASCHAAAAAAAPSEKLCCMRPMSPWKDSRNCVRTRARQPHRTTGAVPHSARSSTSSRRHTHLVVGHLPDAAQLLEVVGLVGRKLKVVRLLRALLARLCGEREGRGGPNAVLPVQLGGLPRPDDHLKLAVAGTRCAWVRSAPQRARRWTGRALTLRARWTLQLARAAAHGVIDGVGPAAARGARAWPSAC